MAILAFALPILPGRTDRAASFGADLTPDLREAYEVLNRHAHLRRHLEWVQPTPAGDLLIVVFESDTPEAIPRAFEDTPYDAWWRARVREVHGFDPADVAFSPPRLVWHWTDDVATGHS